MTGELGTVSLEEGAGTGMGTSALICLLLPLLALWYVYYRRGTRHLHQLAERIPGPKGYPFIGNALEFLGTPDRLFKNIYEMASLYGNVSKFWIGPRLIITLANPDDIELVLSSNVHIDKTPEYKFLEPWLGNGLLISTGEKWRAHRKLIAPTFHLNILKSFLTFFNKNSRAVVDKMKVEGDKEFDCHDYMSEATVEILLETAMGVDKSNQKSGFDYAMAVMKMCEIVHLRHTKLWLRPELVFQSTKYGRSQKKLLGIIHGLTRKVLKTRKEEFATKVDKSSKRTDPVGNDNMEYEKKTDPILKKSDDGYLFGQSAGLKDDLDVEDNDVGEKKRMAFLDLLLECSQQGAVLTDEEIQNQVDTIMFEGHDTTAAASSFFLCMMAARPEIQEKCYQELNNIFGDSNRDVSFQDTLEMKYLERCLMETVRLYPPVPIIARELKEDLKLASCDLVVPAKCTLVIAIIKLHRNEEYYPNPDSFDPDNFLPERSASRHYYSFIPFSAGPRSCVGRKYAMLKLKVLLSTILRNYKVLPGKEEKDWVLQGDVILKMTGGFNIRMEPRKRANA